VFGISLEDNERGFLAACKVMWLDEMKRLKKDRGQVVKVICQNQATKSKGMEIKDFLISSSSRVSSTKKKG